MLKHIVRLRVGLVLLLGILLFCSDAFAMGNDYRDRGNNRGNNRGDNRGDNRNYNGGERHYYRDGRWYKHDQRGNEVSVADIVIGAIAEALPPQHQTVVIQNTQYYYDNSHYYRPIPQGGYVVVAPPRRQGY